MTAVRAPPVRRSFTGGRAGAHSAQRCRGIAYSNIVVDTVQSNVFCCAPGSTITVGTNTRLSCCAPGLDNAGNGNAWSRVTPPQRTRPEGSSRTRRTRHAHLRSRNHCRDDHRLLRPDYNTAAIFKRPSPEASAATATQQQQRWQQRQQQNDNGFPVARESSHSPTRAHQHLDDQRHPERGRADALISVIDRLDGAVLIGGRIVIAAIRSRALTAPSSASAAGQPVFQRPLRIDNLSSKSPHQKLREYTEMQRLSGL